MTFTLYIVQRATEKEKTEIEVTLLSLFIRLSPHRAQYRRVFFSCYRRTKKYLPHRTAGSIVL